MSELLALSLEQPPLPARIYQYILDFLLSKPTPEEIIAFRPTSEMEERYNPVKGAKLRLRKANNSTNTSGFNI